MYILSNALPGEGEGLGFLTVYVVILGDLKA
jgi:hypothetical protein